MPVSHFINCYIMWELVPTIFIFKIMALLNKSFMENQKYLLESESNYRANSINNLVWVIISLVVIALFIGFLVFPLFEGGAYPWGTDVHGYLARVWRMSNSLKSSGTIPQWFPNWYNGTALLEYYPPLTTYIMVPIQLLTNNITLTYKIFVISTLFLSGIFSYFLVKRWTKDSWAVLAALAFIGAPYTVFSVFDEGNLQKALSFVLMPVVLGYILRFLETGKREAFLGLVLSTVLLILTHHQQAVLILAIFSIITLIQIRKERWFNIRIIMVACAFVIGILLCSAWLIPALTHFDYPTVPDLSLFPERLHLFSVSWRVLDPGARNESLELVYIGFSLLLVGFFSVLLRRTRIQLAFFIGAVVSITFAFGVNNPIFRSIPVLSNSVFPERFINIATFLLAILIAGLGATISKYLRGKLFFERMVFLAITSILLVDFMPYWQLVKTSDYPTVRQSLDLVQLTGNSSRLDVRSGEGSIWSLMPLINNQTLLSYGWSIETTPHLAVAGQNNLALRLGFPEFVLRNYRQWNVESAIIPENEAGLISELESNGYNIDGRVAGNVILNTHNQASLTHVLNSNSIVIGRGAFSTSVLFPWFTYGTYWNIDDYTSEYLNHFSLIYLYDFQTNNPLALEQRIRKWIADGKTVIIDLTGHPYDSYFGVWAQNSEYPDNSVFLPGPEIDIDHTEYYSQPFVDEAGGWRGVTYYGLDETILDVVDLDGNKASVFGAVNLPEGKLYFLGFNWITHALLAHDQASIQWLDNIFEKYQPQRNIQPEPFPIILQVSGGDDWAFSYQSNTDTPVMISETWSRHWIATLDGVQIPIQNHENLMLIELPAGNHLVSFHYGATTIQWVGWGITLFAVLILLVIYLNLYNIYRSFITPAT